MKDLRLIKFWLFDLDNTLYSGKTKVFEQIDKKMSKYISEKLNVDINEAKKIQKSYFYQYDTTLRGLVKNHKIDAEDFLDFVHDINIDFLKQDLHFVVQKVQTFCGWLISSITLYLVYDMYNIFDSEKVIEKE